MKGLACVAAVLALSLGALAWAAPDEDKLGKSLGYPIAKIGNTKDWYDDESVRVGSFTHQANIPGLSAAPHYPDDGHPYRMGDGLLRV